MLLYLFLDHTQEDSLSAMCKDLDTAVYLIFITIIIDVLYYMFMHISIENKHSEFKCQ